MNIYTPEVVDGLIAKLESRIDFLQGELEAEKTRVGMQSAGWKETIRQLNEAKEEVARLQKQSYDCAKLLVKTERRCLVLGQRLMDMAYIVHERHESFSIEQCDEAVCVRNMDVLDGPK